MNIVIHIQLNACAVLSFDLALDPLSDLLSLLALI